MDNYYLYFNDNEKEARGLTLLNTGCTRIEKNSFYPPVSHPGHHNFSWNTGRVLQEYQLIYITRGGGLFESESCREEISAGTIILLQPGERHRYRPHPQSGWDETWVGFKGQVIEEIVRANAWERKEAVFRVGCREMILNIFNDINRFSREGRPGYEQVIAGAIVYLLGLIHVREDEGGMIDRACALFRERIYENVSAAEVAAELRVGYSLFRKMFKQQMGVAPGQYLIALRIEKARELLADHSKPVKEVAYDLNMDPDYFCKLFKERVGMTPAVYRRGVAQ